MKILMVLTSHDQLGNTGKKTGFWLEEFAAPYYAFKDAGAQLTLASPKGGQPPLDPNSDEPDAQTEATERFRQDPAAQSALASTVVLGTVKTVIRLRLSKPSTTPANRSPPSAMRRVCCVMPRAPTASHWSRASR